LGWIKVLLDQNLSKLASSVEVNEEELSHVEKLKTLLSAKFRASGKPVVFWYDKDIAPGDDWDDKIKAKVDSCAYSLMVVSEDMLGTRPVIKH